jgi:uncharacterized membrane protein
MEDQPTCTNPSSPQDLQMDGITILIVFVELVITLIYLISLLLIVIRRAKKLIELRNRKYYIVIALYITSKLILSSILVINIIAGIPDKWKAICPS